MYNVSGSQNWKDETLLLFWIQVLKCFGGVSDILAGLQNVLGKDPAQLLIYWVSWSQGSVQTCDTCLCHVHHKRQCMFIKEKCVSKYNFETLGRPIGSQAMVFSWFDQHQQRNRGKPAKIFEHVLVHVLFFYALYWSQQSDLVVHSTF